MAISGSNKMTKSERQAIDRQIPKCRCGNNLSMARVGMGIDRCPACDEPDYEAMIVRIRNIVCDSEKYDHEKVEEIELIVKELD